MGSPDLQDQLSQVHLLYVQHVSWHTSFFTHLIPTTTPSFKKNGSQSGHIVLLATRFILALFLFLSSFLFLLLPSLPPSPPPLVQGTGPMQPPPSLLTFLFPFPITPVRLTNPNTLPPAPPSSLGPNAPDPALYDSRTMG